MVLAQGQHTNGQMVPCQIHQLHYLLPLLFAFQHSHKPRLSRRKFPFSKHAYRSKYSNRMKRRDHQWPFYSALFKRHIRPGMLLITERMSYVCWLVDRLVKWPDPTPLAVLDVTDLDLNSCQSRKTCLNQPWQKVRPELLIARSAVSTAHLLTAQRFQSDAPGFVILFLIFLFSFKMLFYFRCVVFFLHHT